MVLVAVVAGSCAAESFGCDDDDDCAGEGQCQWSNYCAFPDDGCDSGLRYGEHAGEFSELCVQPIPQQGDGASTDDGPSSETDTGGSGDAEDDETGTPDGCTCFAAPPGDGWQGPILLQTGASPDEVQACPAVAPSVLLEGVTGLQVAPSQCTHVPSQCSAEIHVFEEPEGCNGAPVTLTLETGSCEPLLGEDVVYLGSGKEQCECTAQPPIATIPEPTWTAAGRVCGGSADECGGGSTCLPDPDPIGGEAICVFQPGDVACPLAGYSQKIVLYEAFDDGRECSHCAPEGPVCTVSLADPECDEPLFGLRKFGDCLGLEAGGYAVQVYDLASEGCEGSFEVSGEVLPTGPTTVCCLA